MERHRLYTAVILTVRSDGTLLPPQILTARTPAGIINRTWAAVLQMGAPLNITKDNVRKEVQFPNISDYGPLPFSVSGKKERHFLYTAFSQTEERDGVTVAFAYTDSQRNASGEDPCLGLSFHPGLDAAGRSLRNQARAFFGPEKKPAIDQATTSFSASSGELAASASCARTSDD
jgi:hypothetical protein